MEVSNLTTYISYIISWFISPGLTAYRYRSEIIHLKKDIPVVGLIESESEGISFACDTLPEKNSSPLRPKRKVVIQYSTIFRGWLLVSGGVVKKATFVRDFCCD